MKLSPPELRSIPRYLRAADPVMKAKKRLKTRLKAIERRRAELMKELDG